MDATACGAEPKAAARHLRVPTATLDKALGQLGLRLFGAILLVGGVAAFACAILIVFESVRLLAGNTAGFVVVGWQGQALVDGGRVVQAMVQETQQ